MADSGSDWEGAGRDGRGSRRPGPGEGANDQRSPLLPGGVVGR